MGNEYEEAIAGFDGWLKAVRGDRIWRDPELCAGCQRHNDWMASIGRLAHGSIWTASENVGMIEPARPPAEAMRAIEWLWAGSAKHRHVLSLGAECYGVAFYWTLERVYGTFRVL